MTEKTAPRPWRSCRPSHTTLSGWSVTIHDGTIPACRAVGVTRAHAVANANLISRSVIINDRVSRILAKQPEDHEEARCIGWLRDKLRQ